MVVGRRFDAQATALTKQGRLAVYPSSHGQEACQIGGVLALRDTDWMFPTYRESMALVARGIDPVQALTLLRGDWHCGYDPMATHTAPQCTPLATHSLHAAGLAYAARRRGEDTVALAFVGDGGTSEGDFHEALNFAAVFQAPVVFLVQNNRYAISVPLAKQTAAPSLAHKGVGYGVRSEQVDGNDLVAVLAVLEPRRRVRPRPRTAVPGRGAHVSHRGPHQRRRRDALPGRRRGRCLGSPGPDPPVGDIPLRLRRVVRRGHRCRASGRGDVRQPAAGAAERGPPDRSRRAVQPRVRRADTRSCASSATWLGEELAARGDDR